MIKLTYIILFLIFIIESNICVAQNWPTYVETIPRSAITNTSGGGSFRLNISENSLRISGSAGFGITLLNVGKVYQFGTSFNIPDSYIGNFKDRSGQNSNYEVYIEDNWLKINAMSPSMIDYVSIDVTITLPDFDQDYIPPTQVSPDFDRNFILSIKPLTEYISSPYNTDSNNQNSFLLKNKVNATVKYFDDLNRKIQTNWVSNTPLQNDIIKHHSYDVVGRLNKDFLPYPSIIQSNGDFVDDPLDNSISYYSSNFTEDFQNTTNPYSEIKYENSVLNRVLEQGSPGEDWQVDFESDYDHTIKFDYQVNKSVDAVKRFEVVFDSNNSTVDHSLKYVGNYAAAQLYKLITKDENWQPGDNKNHTTAEYKNKLGQIVLKRTYNPNDAGVTISHDTYYIYDDYGNLSYVLSPEASSFVSSTPGLTVSSNVIKKLGYYYGYDQRNNLVKKQIPGKEAEYIIYDKLNRPILRQDGNLRDNNTNSEKWMFTKYDIFDRIIYTGIWTSIIPVDIEFLQYQFYNNPNLIHYEEKDSTGGFVSGGTLVNYTKNAFPTSNIEVLSVNYFDDYNFNKEGLTTESSPLYNVEGFSDRTKTLETGSFVKVLDTDKWVINVIKYDKRSRPIYMHSKNEYLESEDITHIKLDFIGLTLETNSKHIKNNSGTIVIVDKYNYDHAQRLLKQIQRVNDQPEELIVFNKYDELGQLVEKKVGGSDASENNYSLVTALQTIDYDYNIRGWLKSINDPSVNDAEKLFAFGINYNDPTQPGNELYNGNISETHWRTQSESQIKRMYSYEYDALNRITNANSWNTNYNLVNVGYDKNGNITGLSRTGEITTNSFGTIDNLTYTYMPGTNQLKTVVDNSGQPEGFNQKFTGSEAYTYDGNGNMTKDENKDITKIEYNHLNLPARIVFESINGNGRFIEYIYDANGFKIEKNIVNQESNDIMSWNVINSTQYAGNFIYNRQQGFNTDSGSQLQFFNHSEGYVEQKSFGFNDPPIEEMQDLNENSNLTNTNNGGFDYIYQYKDHLGNIRLSYKNVDSEEEILTEVFYDDFESASGWDGSGASWGWSVNEFDSSFTYEGNFSARIDPHDHWEKVAHSNEWIQINNKQATDYIISGWVFLENVSFNKAQFFLLMKEEGETGYNTEFDYVETFNRGSWVKMEKRISVPSNIVELNFRIDNDRAGSVWFDNLKIERVDNSFLQIVEEKNYYPFGLEHKGYNNVSLAEHPYGFNGKEEQNELGLEWLDFGARNYDASLGRWMNLDPLAEMMRRHSPYNYAFDNPIFFVDPDGRAPEASQTANVYYDWDEGGYRTQEGKEATHEQAMFEQIGNDLANMDTSLDNGGGNCPSCLSPTNFGPPSVFSEDVGLSDDAKNSLGNKIPNYVSKAILSTKPVAYSLEITGAAEAIGASSMSPWGGIFISRGPDIGNYKNFTSLGLGAGWISASAMAVGYKYYYFGDVRNFSMKTLEGWGNNLSLSADAGAAVGLNMSWVENPNAPGEYLIGVGAGLGVGVGPTIISGQYTRQMNEIHW
ncbi:DUF6443 domain-containing protein [Psychroflexus tropicus]|uniref:DUF6443 domain-containing protein n=1 Tax=Psychroflexus tropicus TaxID=197345 RepID=UPI00035D0E89|nr:DUF6443 domain-containing protein [Psychroflexus tropicus]